MNPHKDKPGSIWYNDWIEYFEKLPTDEERGKLCKAVLRYQENGTTPSELSREADMAFTIMKNALDRDNKKYLERCEVNRENGKKGGRPKKTNGLFDNQQDSAKTIRFNNFLKTLSPDKARKAKGLVEELGFDNVYTHFINTNFDPDDSMLMPDEA